MSIEWDIRLDFELPKEIVEGAQDIAVARAAEHIRQVAVELAPIREGHLRASAGVTVYDHTATIKFPGPYARYQHFELELKHPRGGQALYLEQPMNTETEACTQIMADTLKEAGLG